MTKNISKKETKSKIKSVKTLVSSIKYRLDDVQGMSYYIKDDEEVTERINTQMKKELIETLDSLLILANKLGYSLEDLIQ
jgi:GTPase